MIGESSVVTQVVRNSKNRKAVTFQNAYYILIRNLGANDVNVKTGGGAVIFVPAGSQNSVVIAVDEDKPITESWVVDFKYGNTEVHFLWTYAKPLKTLS
jgi:hypothetical protein